jgi:hypothetical protein
MKNLLNKVLVVLTMSAMFVGNVDATVTKKSGQKPSAPTTSSTTTSMTKRERAAAAMTERRSEISKLDFFELVKTMGEENFSVWSEQDRIDGLVAQYGSLDKAPKNLKLFLIGSDTDKTTAFRAKYREAALKELAESNIKTSTKNLKDKTNQLKEDPNNTELQKEVAEEQSMLASMTSTMKAWATPGAIAAATTAIGTALVLYYDVFGASTFLAPYASKVYGKMGEAAEYMGLGEEGMIGRKARALKAAVGGYVGGYLPTRESLPMWMPGSTAKPEQK